MSEETNNVSVSLEEGGVAVVFLDRPDKMNALNAELLEELSDLLIGLEEDEEVGAIVITGAPGSKRPAFAAGADIAEMADMDPLQLRAHAHLGQTTFEMIEGHSKPVIAAINGFALGGGLELALSCHFRYMAESAKVGLPEITLGIIPGFGGTQRLLRLAGRGAALEMLLTGDPIGAEEAHHNGLVNKIFADYQLLEQAVATARKLASRAPVARTLILDAVQRGAETSLERALATEADLFGLVGATEDVREGLNAFLEKRTPTWKGR